MNRYSTLIKAFLMACFIILTSVASFAQSGQKWSTGGISVSNGDFLGTTNNYPLVFKVNNSEYLRITPTGNVGIASTNPLYKLDLGGRLHLTGNLLADSSVNARSLFASQTINGNSLTITNNGSFGSLNVSGESTFTGLLTAGNLIITGTLGNGSLYTTVSEIKNHILNPEIHRSINDNSTSNTDLWSASKISSEISNVAVNNPVISGHINNLEIHRSINDDGTANTDLWSASKIISEIAAANQIDTITVKAILANYLKVADSVTIGGSVTIGSRSGVVGLNSVAIGGPAPSYGYLDNPEASGWLSFAIGASVKATGIGSISMGGGNISSGLLSIAFGANNNATGQFSIALGNNTISSGNTSLSTGNLTIASGKYAHAGGCGTITGTDTIRVISSGSTAFNFSHVRYDYTGLGAAADNSAILGGVNNTIESGANKSAILGGFNNTIKTGANNSVILGGENIEAVLPNTVYTQNILAKGDVEVHGTITTNALLITDKITVDTVSSKKGNFDTINVKKIMQIASVSADTLHALQSLQVNHSLLIGKDSVTGASIITTKQDSALYIQSAATTDSARSTIINANNDGRVGIGTAAPTEKLTVVGNAKINGNLAVTGTTSIANLHIQTLESDSIRLSKIMAKDSIIEIGSHSLWVNQNQNRVIGRTLTTLYDQWGNPIGFITLTKGICLGEQTFATGKNSFSAGFLNLAQAENSIVLGNGLNGGDGSDINQYLINNIPQSLMIGFNDNVPTFFVKGSETAFELGKVGIGTTNPLDILDVNGNISVTGNGNNGNSWISGRKESGVFSINGNTWSGDGPTIEFYGKSNDSYRGQIRLISYGTGSPHNIPQGDILFTNYNNQQWTDNMIIKAGGNVGIGKNYTSPAAKLDIYSEPSNDWALIVRDDQTNPDNINFAIKPNGEVYARKVKVKLGTFPDYVFKEDYNLLTLDSLDQFLKQNNHLPGIPSESTVLNEGLDLGEINSLLLKKIEELTLYIIEQNKRIETLENNAKNEK